MAKITRIDSVKSVNPTDKKKVGLKKPLDKDRWERERWKYNCKTKKWDLITEENKKNLY